MASDTCLQQSEQRVSIETIGGALAELSGSYHDFEQFLADLFEQCADLRQRCLLLERERTMLQSQEEAARRRIAELTETLAERQRHHARQETQWGGELKNLRCLLEGIVRELPKPPRPTRQK
jgi:regulator of replication initiation timing